jgi:HAD superfamily hydrolase (TIGR01549 family)
VGDVGLAPRAVLLDLDDTIFDHSLTCRAAIEVVRGEYPFLRQRPVDEIWWEYLTMLNGPPPSTGVPPTSAAMREERWRTVARSCGADLGPDEVRALSNRYRAVYLDHRRAVPGAVELVRRLAGSARLGIVTNNEVAEQEEKLRFLGLEGAIDALVISEAVGASKPEPAIFHEALRRLEVAPESAVMIGDSWTNDVVGAEAVGIRAIWFNRFGLPRPDPRAVPELRSFVPPAEAAALVLDAARASRNEAGARP